MTLLVVVLILIGLSIVNILVMMAKLLHSPETQNVDLDERDFGGMQERITALTARNNELEAIVNMNRLSARASQVDAIERRAVNAEQVLKAYQAKNNIKTILLEDIPKEAKRNIKKILKSKKRKK